MKNKDKNLKKVKNLLNKLLQKFEAELEIALKQNLDLKNKNNTELNNKVSTNDYLNDNSKLIAILSKIFYLNKDITLEENVKSSISIESNNKIVEPEISLQDISILEDYLNNIKKNNQKSDK